MNGPGPMKKLEGVALTLLSLSNDLKDDWGNGQRTRQAHYMALRYLKGEIESALQLLRSEGCKSD